MSNPIKDVVRKEQVPMVDDDDEVGGGGVVPVGEKHESRRQESGGLLAPLPPMTMTVPTTQPKKRHSDDHNDEGHRSHCHRHRRHRDDDDDRHHRDRNVNRSASTDVTKPIGTSLSHDDTQLKRPQRHPPSLGLTATATATAAEDTTEHHHHKKKTERHHKKKKKKETMKMKDKVMKTTHEGWNESARHSNCPHDAAAANAADAVATTIARNDRSGGDTRGCDCSIMTMLPHDDGDQLRSKDDNKFGMPSPSLSPSKPHHHSR